MKKGSIMQRSAIDMVLGLKNRCFIVTDENFKDLALFKPKRLRGIQMVNISLMHYYHAPKEKKLKASVTYIDVTLERGSKCHIHSQHCL